MRLVMRIGIGLVVLLGLVEGLMLIALMWPVPGLRTAVWAYWRPLHWLMLGLASFVGLAMLGGWLALRWHQARR